MGMFHQWAQWNLEFWFVQATFPLDQVSKNSRNPLTIGERKKQRKSCIVMCLNQNKMWNLFLVSDVWCLSPGCLINNAVNNYWFRSRRNDGWFSRVPSLSGLQVSRKSYLLDLLKNLPTCWQASKIFSDSIWHSTCLTTSVNTWQQWEKI